MNEAAIWCTGGPLLYFKTNKATAMDAYWDFEGKCREVGINTDNLLINEIILRDEDFNDLDKIEL